MTAYNLIPHKPAKDGVNVQVGVDHVERTVFLRVGHWHLNLNDRDVEFLLRNIQEARTRLHNAIRDSRDVVGRTNLRVKPIPEEPL